MEKDLRLDPIRVPAQFATGLTFVRQGNDWWYEETVPAQPVREAPELVTEQKKRRG